MRNDAKRRTELADFLRTRRARLHPEQFGLATPGRRRTPGLRRDEVAHLTGVGVSWYTWLEQGRDITVSDQVLERLAQTFQLKQDERRHLFLLARGMVPVANASTETASLPHGLQAILDALNTNPAYLLDHRFTLVAWNKSACRVFGDFSLLSERDLNRIWQIFVHPSSRQLFVDWAQAAHHAVMNFRAAYDQYTGDHQFEHLLADLQQKSPEFRTLWAQHNVEAACNFFQEKELNHPQVGRLSLQNATLIVPVDPPLHLVTYTPSSQETLSKLATLEKAEKNFL